MTQEQALEMRKAFQPMIDAGLLPGETTAQIEAKEADVKVLRSIVEAAYVRLQAAMNGA